MQKLKRILALITAAGLIILYLVTFYVGVFAKGDIKGLLLACIVLTVLIPVLLYAMFLVAGVLHDHDKDDSQDKDEDR